MKVYLFSEGSSELKRLLGGKGADLAEMKKLGLHVPPGIIISTEAWKDYMVSQKISEDLKREVIGKLRVVEEETGKIFGGRINPLLVSVRSGAPVSMPGMMDTILNLGLNDMTVMGLAEQTGDERFAYECYHRFISLFGRIVLGVDGAKFKGVSEKYVQRLLEVKALKEIVKEYKALIEMETGKKFPEDVHDQLFSAIKAVFDSWFSQRAIIYRQAHKIPDDLGTAVVVQAMVFGNLGLDSGTGVVFTRNPSIGEKELYGEFLLNAQGEDLVSGVRTPEPISSLREKLPQIYNELVHICQVIEKHFRDMQDIEFTVEKGKLYILQTRSGKRTPQAAVKIAFDMYKEGILSKVEAAKIVRSVPLQELVIQQKDPNVKVEILAKGLPASPGVATGVVVFNSDETRRFKERGEKIILVRPQTSPEDIKGILAADGVLTIRGGMTSHAAVITRDLGKPCVVGCEEIKIDLEAEKFYVNKGAQNIIVSKGEIITVDGTTGYVILGEVPLIVQRLSDYVKELLA